MRMIWRTFIPVSLIVLLLSGCYCRHYYNPYSSVRLLRGSKSFTICSPPPGVSDGKVLLATAYTADPYFEQLKFKRNAERTIREISFDQTWLVGLRAETFFALRGFPGPLLGVGLDYSLAKAHLQNIRSDNSKTFKENQYIQTHYAQLSLNYVTWIRSRMMGYIGLQPGCAWSKRKIDSEMPPYNLGDKNFRTRFNGRISYGFHFYFHPLSAVNIEFGYGNGAFVRAGVSAWLF